MRFRLSRYEDACHDFDLAREMAHQLGDLESEVEILLDEATALDSADEYRRSRELVEQADLMSRDNKSPLIEARILMGLGRSCVRFNSYERAAELYNIAADKAEALGDAAYETYCAFSSAPSSRSSADARDSLASRSLALEQWPSCKISRLPCCSIRTSTCWWPTESSIARAKSSLRCHRPTTMKWRSCFARWRAAC